MFRPQGTSYTYGIFAVILTTLAFFTFNSLSIHLFETDDHEYLAKMGLAIQDLSHLFSQDQMLPVRPIEDFIWLISYSFWRDNAGPYHILQVILHLLSSFLLVYTFRRSGVGLDLSLLASLLFFMNVAHFRTIHWITCRPYILALIFSLCTLNSYLGYLKSGKTGKIILACLAQTAAIFIHPSAVAISFICIYLSWRKNLSVRRILFPAGYQVILSLICFF